MFSCFPSQPSNQLINSQSEPQTEDRAQTLSIHTPVHYTLLGWISGDKSESIKRQTSRWFWSFRLDVTAIKRNTMSSVCKKRCQHLTVSVRGNESADFRRADTDLQLMMVISESTGAN